MTFKNPPPSRRLECDSFLLRNRHTYSEHILNCNYIIMSFGFSFVWLQVAIKVIDRDKIKEEYVRANLYREARILAQLRHPNLVRLYETISVRSLLHLEFVSLSRLWLFQGHQGNDQGARRQLPFIASVKDQLSISQNSS